MREDLPTLLPFKALDWNIIWHFDLCWAVPGVGPPPPQREAGPGGHSLTINSETRRWSTTETSRRSWRSSNPA